MKKLLAFIVVILFLGTIGLASLFLKQKPVSSFTDTIPPVVEQPAKPDYKIINIVNERNAKIKNLASKATFSYYDKYLSISFKGSVNLEKDKKFRILIDGFFGTRMIDIGSNEKEFWFWSKYEHTLNWANHVDYERTRLRDPLHPVWIMSCFGLNQIDSEKIELKELSNKWMFIENVKSSVGQPLRKVGFINKATQKIEGFVLYDRNGNLIASGEVQEWVGDLPKKVFLNWKEENIGLVIDLHHPVTNINIGVDVWRMPDITPKVELK